MPVLPSSNGLPDLPVNGAIPTAAPVPMTQRRITPSLDAQLNGAGGRSSRNLQGTPRANMDATCILIDRQSGLRIALRLLEPLLVASALRQTLFARS